MKRRKFIILLGAGTTLPLIIAARKNSASKDAFPHNTIAMDNEFHTVCSVEQLNEKGMVLVKKTPIGEVLVVKDRSKNVIAVNPKCTHKGCIVEWKDKNQTFDCPCHGSRFSKDGNTLNGPANKPLTKYVTKIEGDSVLVQKTS